MNFVPPPKVCKEGFWWNSKLWCESENAYSIETGEEDMGGEVEILTGLAETVEMEQLGSCDEWDPGPGDGGRSCEYMLGMEYRLYGALGSS